MAPLLRRTGTDDKAFERLYRRHVRDVFRYSLAVLGERADAEDVTQTTFLNAYRAFQRGERPQKPENWLISIAHNVCRQRFRQAQRRPQQVEYADELAPALEPSDGPTAEDLRRAFARLAPGQRSALVMRELEGRSYVEIAEVLGITVSALETLLFRARRALREQLEEQLTCREAELGISRQLDGQLTHAERGALRAHLRGCPECARLAQRQRAQRKVLRSLFLVPLPPGLSSFFHPAAAQAAAATTATGALAAGATGTGIAVKAAAVVAGAALVGGGTYAGVEKVPPLVREHAPGLAGAVHLGGGTGPPATGPAATHNVHGRRQSAAARAKAAARRARAHAMQEAKQHGAGVAGGRAAKPARVAARGAAHAPGRQGATPGKPPVARRGPEGNPSGEHGKAAAAHGKPARAAAAGAQQAATARRGRR
ncbi:MAG TPA: sigma-70 family RNA polymerase sigma factor [Gaiellaceae bacterium]|nr:sigma-70 family RNA polymerase sigma factor [Gaiellaceae bacterium]